MSAPLPLHPETAFLPLEDDRLCIVLIAPKALSEQVCSVMGGEVVVIKSFPHAKSSLLARLFSAEVPFPLPVSRVFLTLQQNKPRP